VKYGKFFKQQRGIGEVEALVWVALVGLALTAWATHVVVCLKTASWGFLIAGAIMAPVGMIHGVGIWFGAW
jgi:hypothetical protein